MKLTLNVPSPKRLTILLGCLIATAAFALTYSAVSDQAQTFSNDKTFNGNITIAPTSSYTASLSVTGTTTLTGAVNTTGAISAASQTVTGVLSDTSQSTSGALSVTLGLLIDGGYAVALAPDGGYLPLLYLNGGLVINSPTPQGVVIDGGTLFQGAVTLPATAAAGAVSYFAGGPPEALFGISQVALANTTKLGGYCLPGANSVGTARAFTITAFNGGVTSASGGGAANTVITLTDGTNVCTATIPCNSAPPAGSSSTGGIRIAGVNGAGTGCVYPSSACITGSVTTAGCTTTQPTILGQFEGTWQ
jgi:hypothetical protein